MSKAELISTINSVEKPDILDSIGLLLHQISHSSDSISGEEKVALDLGVKQAENNEMRDYAIVMAELRAKLL
jgi:hypothetical protein